MATGKTPAVEWPESAKALPEECLVLGSVVHQIGDNRHPVCLTAEHIFARDFRP